MKNSFTKLLVLFCIIIQFSNLTKAQSITLALPIANNNYLNTIPVQWNITPTSQSLAYMKVVFTYTSGYYSGTLLNKTWTLFIHYPPFAKAFALNPTYLDATFDTFFTVLTNSGDTLMPNGTYSVKATYTRTDSVSFNSATVSFSLTDAGYPPDIKLPLSNSYVKNNFTIIDTTNEVLRVSGYPVYLLFENGSGTVVDSIFLSSAQKDSFTLNINNTEANAVYVRYSDPTTLAPGIYNIVMGEYDNSGHAATYDTVYNVTIDTTVISPTITAPSSGTQLKSSFNVSFSLPKKATLNTTKLVFQQGSVSDTLVISDTSLGSHSITIDPTYLGLSTDAVSSNGFFLAGGQYTLQVIYTDLEGNITSAQTNFQLQTDTLTLTPTLTLPSTNGSDVGTSNVTFTLPEYALPNSVHLEYFGCNVDTVTLDATTPGTHTYALNSVDLGTSTGVVSASSNALYSGTYAVVLSYQDSSGNPRSYTLNSNYSFTNTVLGLNLDMLKGFMQLAKTHLQWETATEEDLAYFDVQYSIDTKNFSDIGKVKAVGTSYVKHDYGFIHNDPLAAKNYYRLRMVNQDGTFSYSPVILVYKGTATDEFGVFPNPAKDKLNVTIITSNATEMHTLNIWGMDGKLVKTITVEASNGSNLFTVPINDLSSGNYVLQDGNNISLFLKND